METAALLTRNAHRCFLRSCLQHPVVEATMPKPEPKPMDDVDAIMLIEGGDADDEQIVEAFQHLLDSGIVWKLQGFYGRTARNLIDAGLIVER